MLVEGIEHAARAISIWFLHLLRSDVNSPPQRPIHCDILIEDVGDQPSPRISWVGLYIDCLQRLDKVHISECDILDTIAPDMRRHASHTHPHSQDHCAVLHQHILCAVTSTRRLGHDYIVVVLDGEVVEMHACPAGVDAVSVEREQGYHAFQSEFLQKVDLCSNVDLYVEVEEFGVEAAVHLDVELGGVLES